MLFGFIDGTSLIYGILYFIWEEIQIFRLVLKTYTEKHGMLEEKSVALEARRKEVERKKRGALEKKDEIFKCEVEFWLRTSETLLEDFAKMPSDSSKISWFGRLGEIKELDKLSSRFHDILAEESPDQRGGLVELLEDLKDKSVVLRERRTGVERKWKEASEMEREVKYWLRRSELLMTDYDLMLGYASENATSPEIEDVYLFIHRFDAILAQEIDS